MPPLDFKSREENSAKVSWSVRFRRQSSSRSRALLVRKQTCLGRIASIVGRTRPPSALSILVFRVAAVAQNAGGVDGEFEGPPCTSRARLEP